MWKAHLHFAAVGDVLQLGELTLGLLQVLRQLGSSRSLAAVLLAGVPVLLVQLGVLPHQRVVLLLERPVLLAQRRHLLERRTALCNAAGEARL